MKPASSPTLRDLDRRIRWASIAIAFVGLSFVLVTTSQIWTARFNDSDDYMRMVQVANLLDGQSWFDVTQPRLSPGEHPSMSWSRIVDLPLACVMLLAEPFVGRMGAAGVAAFMVPLLLLAVFVFYVPLLGRGAIPRRYAWLMVVAALASFPLLRELRPMRVDHHGWQVMLAMLTLGTLRLYILKPCAKFRVVSGALCALGLAVGAEAFFWTALTAAAVGGDAAWGDIRANRMGRKRTGDAALFGLSFLLAVLLLLPVITPMRDWAMHDFARLSRPQLLFAGLTAGVLLLLHETATPARGWRFLMLGSGAVIGFTVFVMLLPEIRGGLYPGMSAGNRSFILGNVLEAWPFMMRLRGMELNWPSLIHYWPLIGQNLYAPAVALLVTGATLWRSRGTRRRLWALQALFLAPACLFGMFWQSRLTTYMQLGALLPMAWLAAQVLQGSARKGWRPAIALLQGVAVFVLLPLPQVALGLLALDTPLAQIVLYPSWYQRKPCGMQGVAAILNDPKELGGRPRNIMTTMSGGAELLFRTRHSVYAAPYNLQGNGLAWNFFTTNDMGAARMLASARGVDLVLVCDDFAPPYYPDQGAKSLRRIAFAYRQRGQPAPDNIADQRIMIDRLTGDAAPAWLTPMPVPDPRMHLFIVQLREGVENAIKPP